MVAAIQGVKPRTVRQRRALQRILKCLSPLASSKAQALPRLVVNNVVTSFTNDGARRSEFG